MNAFGAANGDDAQQLQQGGAVLGRWVRMAVAISLEFNPELYPFGGNQSLLKYPILMTY